MKWVVTSVFLAVLAGHFLYATRIPAATTTRGPWASYGFDPPKESRAARYVRPGEYWLGTSYALASAFAAFCLARLLRLRRRALTESAGGITVSGILWAGVCFLTGCCGSPMLPIYLGLFGPKFLNVTKPLTFGVTLVSIAVGYAWMLKRAPKAMAENVDPCLHEAPGANPGQV